MQTIDALIRTKLCLPYVRPGLVPRARLDERIAEGLNGPLTLVIAPAGFGKTTLVVSSVVQAGRPVAWLSLDKDDNQLERFLSYLHESHQKTGTRIPGLEDDHCLGWKGGRSAERAGFSRVARPARERSPAKHGLPQPGGRLPLVELHWLYEIGI